MLPLLATERLNLTGAMVERMVTLVFFCLFYEDILYRSECNLTVIFNLLIRRVPELMASGVDGHIVGRG